MPDLLFVSGQTPEGLLDEIIGGSDEEQGADLFWPAGSGDGAQPATQTGAYQEHRAIFQHVQNQLEVGQITGQSQGLKRSVRAPDAARIKAYPGPALHLCAAGEDL